MYKFLPELPPVERDPAIIDRFLFKPLLGSDLEWNQHNEPTIIGISDGKTTVSVPWADGIDRFRELLAQYNVTWVGHNLVAADLLILERLGLKIPLEMCEDTIIWMWLTNMHLAKAAGKSALAEDEDEKRGRGFFNLGTMLSVYTDIWHYKDCRGPGCLGPCPEHDPYGYNGIDSLGPVLALPSLKRQAQLKGVASLYPMHRELAYVLAQMQEYGIKVDVPYLQSLNEKFLTEKGGLEETLPFNPQSPKAVVDYFRDYGLKDAQEATISDLVDDLGDTAPTHLTSLLEYKQLGNGTDRWFQPQYRDKNGWLKGYLDPDGFVHPRLNMFTSSGRLACSSPNLQNVLKRKGEQMRRAIIAPEGWYIVRGDASNAENRVVLHFAGHQIPRDLDLHTWVAELSGLTEDMDFVKRTGGGKPRQAAKSIQHAGNILEGLQLKTSDQLRAKKLRAEVDAGARIVYPNWRFHEKIVTFTGVNLSRRVYGDATWDHRRDALQISDKYFARFSGIRDFQKTVSQQCERDGCIRTPCGYVILSFGYEEDRMKIAQGIQQQNPVAHLTKRALLTLWRRWERDHLMRPALQIHDEIVCYCKNEVPPDVAMSWLREAMEEEIPEIPGMSIPCEPTYGSTWAESDQKTVDF